MGDHGNNMSFEDLVQNESIAKERALLRISQAKRERSGSNLSLDKIVERPTRTEKYSKDSTDDLDEEDEDDDDEDDDYKDEHTKDLRKALFESIPEPYPHTLNYQRVVISDAGDPADYDTKDACAKLKACMDIRDKWINAHPFPPQDLENAFPPDLAPNSPDRPANRKKGEEINYRRRLPPTYEVFGVPLPPTVHHLQFKMVKGVVMVHTVNNMADPGSSPVGLSLTTESADADDALESLRKKIDDSLDVSHDEEIDKVFLEPEVVDEDGQDWNKSIFPVHSYSEYVKDYYFVSVFL